MNKQIEEMNRPRNEELFNNLDKQYREIAKIQEREKQIDIIEADIKTGMRDMEEVNPKVYKGLNYRTAAKHLDAIGYRKCVVITEDMSQGHADPVGALGTEGEDGYRKQEWISVEERLPVQEGKYLVCTTNGNIGVGNFIDYYGKGTHLCFGCWTVTHWMPLPEPPTMRKEDEGK